MRPDMFGDRPTLVVSFDMEYSNLIAIEELSIQEGRIYILSYGSRRASHERRNKRRRVCDLSFLIVNKRRVLRLITNIDNLQCLQIFMLFIRYIPYSDNVSRELNELQYFNALWNSEMVPFPYRLAK